MSLAKKLKSLIKGEKPTFGTNPWDPWSTKAGISESESGMLNRYLNSRGINPQFVSKDTKISHAKSAEFAKWKNDHQFDDPKDTLNTVMADNLRRQKKSIDGGIKESVDKKDTVTFDIPLLIRVLELTREDIKTDADLHRVVERLINIRKKGVLTMKDYNYVTKIRESLETGNLHEVFRDPTPMDHETVKRHLHNLMGIPHDEKEPTATPAVHRAIKKVSTAGSSPTKSRSREILHALIQKHHIPIDAEHRALLNKEETQVDEAKTIQGTALDRFRMAALEREKKHNAIEKARQEKLHQNPEKVNVPVANTKKDDMTKAIDRLEKHLNKEEIEQIDELKKSTVKSWLGKQEVVPPKKPGMDKKAHNQRIKTRSKSWDRAVDRLSGAKPTSEDVYQDSQAATQTVFDVANNPDDCSCDIKKKQMSKSARIIKNLYKKKGMTEGADGQAGGGMMYDKEKTDKSEATYGKKPKTQKQEVQQSFGDNKPQAAAVLSGGKTLTGQTRDTLEIDPMMRKPVSPDGKKLDK